MSKKTLPDELRSVLLAHSLDGKNPPSSARAARFASGLATLESQSQVQFSS